MQPQQIGRFKIDGRLLHRDWRELLPLMKHFVVIRCEFMYATDRFEFTAFSELFKPVEAYQAPPWYEIQIHNNDIGEIKTIVAIPVESSGINA